ncbi:MAG TPA: hypothetical protein VEC36_12830 [Patescibacteria group bacterium]|nr:hypothetical protein [Patescibacteria group bacterium]
MSIFKEIDSKIENLAMKLNARLTKDRPGYPEVLRTFEERRIDWIDNGIHKAIIIQPTFENKGVNSKIWNVTNIAWINEFIAGRRPQLIINLIDQKEFKVIENNIDELLKTSEENLIKITRNDLK